MQAAILYAASIVAAKIVSSHDSNPERAADALSLFLTDGVWWLHYCETGSSIALPKMSQACVKT